jgi:hypothetical protein
VLTLNKFLWLKFEVFTGSPIHPPPLGALSCPRPLVPLSLPTNYLSLSSLPFALTRPRSSQRPSRRAGASASRATPVSPRRPSTQRPRPVARADRAQELPRAEPSCSLPSPERATDRPRDPGTDCRSRQEAAARTQPVPVTPRSAVLGSRATNAVRPTSVSPLLMEIQLVRFSFSIQAP